VVGELVNCDDEGLAELLVVALADCEVPVSLLEDAPDICATVPVVSDEIGVLMADGEVAEIPEAGEDGNGEADDWGTGFPFDKGLLPIDGEDIN
jgi:hypothetical protein